MINKGIVINVLGSLAILLGLMMLLAMPFAAADEGKELTSIGFSSGISIVLGFILWVLSRGSSKDIGKREGFLIVALGWIFVSVLSTLPYLLSGVIPHFSSALFESVSGLSTTGSTVLNDIEIVPSGILFWRSLTQWIGGMGIIVLTVAIFPLLGIGGVELFVNEAPGPTSNKINPRIRETAKRLWLIYVSLTATVCVLLNIFGMNFFDAINHALTTISTGGFSTKNASIAHFQNSNIEYIITLFMFIAGLNYTIIYFSIKRKFKKVWGSDEFRTYITFVPLVVLLVSICHMYFNGSGVELSFRESSFQVVSIITTTGYVSADYTAWSPFITLLFFILLFVGACAGSTSGGIKIIRHLVFFKNSVLELKRLIHPLAMIRVKIDKEIVAPKVLTHILVFLMFYIILFVFGSLVMAIILRDFDQPLVTAFSAVASSIGNVGPGIGELGPTDNFAGVPYAGKWILILFMILGRLEIFTVLVLFTPFFWRRN